MQSLVGGGREHCKLSVSLRGVCAKRSCFKNKNRAIDLGLKVLSW
jgi:hypothetical protein